MSEEDVMKKQKRNRILRTCAGILLAFVASVFLTLSAVSCTLLCVLSEGSMRASLDRVSYAEKVIPNLEDQLDELANPSGLPDGFFAGKTDLSDVKDLLDQSIRSRYAGEAFKPDTASLEQKLSETFYAYAEANGIKASEEAVNTLVQLCVNKYVGNASPTAFSYLISYALKLTPYLWIAFGAGLLVSTVILCYLIRIRMIAYVCFAAGGAGLMLFLAPFVLLVGSFVKRLNVSPEAVRLFLSDYLNRPLTVLLICGAVLIAASVVLAFWAARAKQARLETGTAGEDEHSSEDPKEDA